MCAIPNLKILFPGPESLSLNVYDDSAEAKITEAEDDPFQLYRFHYLPVPSSVDTFQRVTRGVAEECCLNPCHITALKLYCKNRT